MSKPDKNKIADFVGRENIGVWHFADNVVKLQKVLANIPEYLDWFYYILTDLIISTTIIRTIESFLRK